MERGDKALRRDPSPRRQSQAAGPESHAALLHRLREIRMAVEGWQATAATRSAAPVPATNRSRTTTRLAAPEDAAETDRLAEDFTLRLINTQRTLKEASSRLHGVIAPPVLNQSSPATAAPPAPRSKATERASSPLPTLPIKNNQAYPRLPVRHASTQSERSPQPPPVLQPSKPPPLVSTATQSSPKPQIWESRSPCSLKSQASPAPAAWAIPTASLRASPIVAAVARHRDSPAPYASLYGDGGVSVACKAHLVRPDDLNCGCCEWCGRRVEADEPAAEVARGGTRLEKEDGSAESIDGSNSSLLSTSRGDLSAEASAEAAPAEAERPQGSVGPRTASRSAALAALKLRRLSQLST